MYFCRSVLILSLIFSVSIVSAQVLEDSSVDFEKSFFQALARRDGVVHETDVLEVSSQNNDNDLKIPNGLSTKDMSQACEPRRFEERVLSAKVSSAEYYKALKNYFSKCSKELMLRSQRGLPALLAFSKVQYSFLSHPQIKSFPIKLSNGITVPGILALKQDSRPRPLVILRCGVFCSVSQTASLRNYLMYIFDQSPFNVLLLANQTGMDYISTNKHLSMGGWSEGRESLEVAKWMRQQWVYKERVSSVHYMGISLAGNGAVLGAAFNDKYLLPNGKKILNSVAAICPVVSLKPTLQRLYGSPIIGTVVKDITTDHLREAREYVTDVPDLLADEKLSVSRNRIPELLGFLASTSLQRRGVASTTEDFFKSTNFWNWKEEVKTPLLVWASKDDMVVNNEVNTEVMANDDFYSRSSSVGVLNLDYGNHCGFSTVYGTQAAGLVLRSFVLKNSPEFVNDYNAHSELAWTFGFPKMNVNLQHANQVWKFVAKSPQAQVDFRIFDWTRGDCGRSYYWNAPPECIKTESYSVPISELKSLGARIPRNSTEAESLTREFNTKVEFRSKKGPLTGSESPEFFMTWKNHFE